MATTLFDFSARSNVMPSTSPATPLKVNDVQVLAFDATTEEFAVFSGIMPQAYAAGTLSAIIHYAMDTATSGAIVWAVEVEALADNEAWESDSFDSVNSSVALTVPGTAGTGDIASVTLTNKDSVAAGERVRFRVRRDADGGSDTATGDAHLYRVEIREA